MVRMIYILLTQYIWVIGYKALSLYKDEVEECENLTEEDADYIIDIDGIKFYIFNT